MLMSRAEVASTFDGSLYSLVGMFELKRPVSSSPSGVGFALYFDDPFFAACSGTFA